MLLRPTLIAVAVALASVAAVSLTSGAPAFAQDADAQDTGAQDSGAQDTVTIIAALPDLPEGLLAFGTFTKKRIRVHGSWELVVRDDGVRELRFDDAFRTRNGPDLKVFLSPRTIGDATGTNAVDGSLLLGGLQSNRGAQVYEIPADVDLSAYASFLVHCEAYAKLWGGADLHNPDVN